MICSIIFLFFYYVFFFFFNDTATTEIYTLSLHDALPILNPHVSNPEPRRKSGLLRFARNDEIDRKSTRLNSSHTVISYAVFCLKKKKKNNKKHTEKQKTKKKKQQNYIQQYRPCNPH